MADASATGTSPVGKNHDPDKGNNPTANSVQRTRAWTGLWVIAAGDVAILAIAVWGLYKVSGSTISANGSSLVAILTSAFTAIGTMTTAYFGIRSASNTAQSYAAQSTSTHQTSA